MASRSHNHAPTPHPVYPYLIPTLTLSPDHIIPPSIVYPKPLSPPARSSTPLNPPTPNTLNLSASPQLRISDPRMNLPPTHSNLSKCSNLVNTTCLLVSSISPARKTSSRIAYTCPPPQSLLAPSHLSTLSPPSNIPSSPHPIPLNPPPRKHIKNPLTL